MLQAAQAATATALAALATTATTTTTVAATTTATTSAKVMSYDQPPLQISRFMIDAHAYDEYGELVDVVTYGSPIISPVNSDQYGHQDSRCVSHLRRRRRIR